NQQVADVVGQLRGQQQANGRIGLVDGAIGADAVGVLGDPAAVAQPGGSVVAGAGIDLRQAVAHGGRTPRPSARAAPAGVRAAARIRRTAAPSRPAYSAAWS